MSERLHRDNVPAARRLRERETQSERLLWGALRDRGVGGYKFRRQHPVGIFVLDFYCEDLRLAIEVDGPIHDDQNVAERDAMREEIIRERAIWFFRVSAADVETNLDGVINRLRVAISLHRRDPEARFGSPLPPQWERGRG